MRRRRFMFLGAMAAASWRPARLAAGQPATATPSGQSGGPGAPPYRTSSRTKVVRLIVVPEKVDPGIPKAIQQIAADNSASKADVFIVLNKATGLWEPRSWLGTNLMNHDQAVHSDRETVVIAMVLQREQIQWESSVEFGITSIEKKTDVKETALINRGPSPDDPFDGRLLKQTGQPGTPIRSGPPSLNGETDLENLDSPLGYDQLYKITFRMVIGGQERVIDPDVYCDWG